ncbi:MAG: PAS domain-containing sensor histidine kinase [Mucilaginibacter sp.]
MNTDANTSLPEDIFRVIFEKSPGSILVKANIPHFTILAASDSYLKVTSSTRNEIVGKGFFEAFPDDEATEHEETAARKVFTRVIETGQKIDVPTYKYDIYNPDTGLREPHFWSCTNIPVMDTQNKIAYILNTVTDITEEVKAKEDAIESENRLRMATEATGLATWELDIATWAFIYTPRLPEIFGYSADAKPTLDDIRSHISAEDMEQIVKPSHFASFKTGEHKYEIKVQWADGSIHWIRTQGTVEFNAAKQPLRLIGTVLDITESKRDEIRKNDFIAMASHELKTPLTSLKAYIQLLAQKLGKTNDPFISNALNRANNQANKMAALIYGFLDLSRLESGRLQVKLQTFDINKLIADMITEANMVNYNHQIVFKPLAYTPVNADIDRIGQVISNFLSNAIKYSPSGSTITVEVKTIDNDVQVSVADTGIGIKPKDQEKIFQRFYRVENEQIKIISGFGIGLYLASEIIQRHKGKIWVESYENEGSVFFFSLPLAS